MTTPLLSLSSESYQNSIFCGFSRLQGNQEFVDLTLAADGHLVKVHKNIIALASPYLKEMIQSLSSDNTVIFLNNVCHSMLRFLLEYIYQGKVNIPQESLASFLEVAKSLHIIGISNDIEPEQKKNAADDNIIQPPTQARKNIIQKSNSVTKPNIVPQSSNVSQILFKPLEETAVLTQPETVTFPSQEVKTNFDVLANMEVLGSSLIDDMPIYTIDSDVDPRKAVSTGKSAAMTNITESVAPSQIEFNDQSDIEMWPTNFAASIKISCDRNFEVQQFDNVQLLTSDEATTNENNSQIPKAICQENMPDLENMDYGPSQDINIDENNLINSNTGCLMVQPIQSASNSAELNAASKLSLKQPVMLPTIQLNEEAKAALNHINQFSVSERGSVQIIVNRYIYASHHNSKQGRKHRWRCLDYRKLRCPAYIDSFDNRIIARKGAHKHEYHDVKIHEKIKRNLIYHTIEQATEGAEQHNNFNSIQCGVEDIFSEITE